jgi:hypothetical protein
VSTGQLILGVVLLGVVVLVASPFVFAGLSLVYEGLVTRRRTSRAVRSAVIDPAEIPATGYATVAGQAESGPSGRVEAPLTGRSGLAYRLRVQQKRDDGDWWTVVDTVDIGSIELVGQAGRVVVEPGDAEPDLELDTEVTAGSDGRLPDGASERIRNESLGGTGDGSLLPAEADKPRRYQEGLLEPGTTIHVHGACSSSSTGEPRIEAAEPGGFRLGPDPPNDHSAEARSKRETAIKKVAGGGMLTLLGCFALVMFGWIPFHMILNAI